MMLNSIVKLVFEMNFSDYLSLSFSFSLSLPLTLPFSSFLSQSSYSIWVSFVGVQSFRPFHIAEQTK